MMICSRKEMMSPFSVLSSIALFILFLSSCTKLDSTSLGGDFIPGSDKLITDTMTISVSTTSIIENDTTIIDKGALHALGYVNDPMFGSTTGSVYFQMLPALYPFSYPVKSDSLFLDSLVLSLDYNFSYGDTNALSKVSVYKINDVNFKPAKRYLVSEIPNFSVANFLGSQTFSSSQLRKGYKLNYKTDSVFNQLRIKLDDALGLSILKENTETGFFRNDTAFKAFLNGLVVVPDSLTSGNALHYFTLNSSNSRLNLYFRYRKRDGGLDTTFTSFPFVADTIRSASGNKIHRNYSGSTALPVLNSNSPSSLAYLQTAPGTGVNIKVPQLSSLIGKSYLIHRAELVVRQIYQGPVLLENQLVQPYLHLFTQAGDGKNTSIPFDSINYLTPSNFDFIRNVVQANIVLDYSGGIPSYFTDASGNRVAEYRHNITRYVQNLITGKTELRDFKLEAPYYANFKLSGGFSNNITGGVAASSQFLSPINPVAYGRLQAGGGSHPQYPMVVRIYYSKQ
jgi:Domain of unknown function (DUF4270)